MATTTEKVRLVSVTKIFLNLTVTLIADEKTLIRYMASKGLTFVKRDTWVVSDCLFQ